MGHFNIVMNMRTLVIVTLFMCLELSAADNGSQLLNSFRVNYAGYHPQANKTALFVSSFTGPIKWSLSKGDCEGMESNYVSNDKSSGDSFYIIDFSKCTAEGKAIQITVGDSSSAPFDITPNPLGELNQDFFAYFQQHEASATFKHSINNWADISLSFRYVKDAGDNGVYPTNTAEAAWSLIHLLETYPDVNDYYAEKRSGLRTVYQQLEILTEQFHHIMNNPRQLAIPKLHTNVASYGPCAPHPIGSTCISEPETKATYATARTLAAMARIDLKYVDHQKAMASYDSAKRAMDIANTLPLTCNQADSFGGEGGMYPDNDVWAAYRQPQKERDNCHPDPNNTADDQFAAYAELYISATQLKLADDAARWKTALEKSTHYSNASSFWWGAVAMEGNLSLLSHESLLDLNLDSFKQSLLDKAAQITTQQNKGYPGVTWDPNSTQWNNGDYDLIDNNVRWGSHRMALNDARILIAAATLQRANNNSKQAAALARSAVKVLDHMSGINAMNLAMFTAKDYNHIEHAIERTHDGSDPKDLQNGKLVLGPNNWTNANDPDMPAFGSLPGLKMMSMNGAGWSSREVSIDANAALVPIAYFAAEIAPSFYQLAPLSAK